jgi:hypothetical protein
MTKKELINKNIGITFDFLRYIVDHPEMIDSIPNGAELSFIDKDMPISLEEIKLRDPLISASDQAYTSVLR